MRPGDPAWHSAVEAPLVVDDAAAVRWDHATDLLVVGFGAAGVSAALEASERGLEVIALDRAEGGGATQLSGGVVYAGGGTRVQRETGEQDTPQAMFDYLKLETRGVVADETLMRFCEQSAATLDWMSGHGVRFSGPVFKKKTSYPSVKYFLYHSDNSLLPAYRAVAPPAARGHRGVIRRGRSATNLGGSIYLPMRDSALARGVQLHRKSEARQLVVDRDGRVLGVRALQIPADSDAYRRHARCLRRGEFLLKAWPFPLPGSKSIRRRARGYFAEAAAIEASARESVLYRARRGVCLSAGGFIFNRAMVEHHCPKYRDGYPLGTPADDGSGIRLGQSVGGVTDRMARATAWRFLNPPIAWSQGIVVNARGERFVNESCYGATIGAAMVEEQGGKAWLILDSRLLRESWLQIAPGRVLPFQRQLAMLNMLFGRRKAKSLEACCARFGFERDALAATVEAYNAVARGEGEDPFAKAPEDVRELNAPFHVIDISLDARLLPCTVLSMGGLVVDERTGLVRGTDGAPIEGLYAAGRTAVGIPSHLYMSGLSIADGIFAGRRAGRHVAGA